MAPVICIASAYPTTRVSYQCHTNCDEWRQMVIRTAKRTHLTRSCVAVPQRAVVSSKEFSTQNLNRLRADRPTKFPPYSLTFQTYKNVASLAVATLRPAFRVARFSAERTFSFDSVNSAKGTLSAAPAFSWSRSLRIAVTICLCFPLRPCGTSNCTMVAKCIGAVLG